MFAYLDTLQDTRVRREAAALVEAGYEVTVVGRPPSIAASSSMAGGGRTHTSLDGVVHVAVPVPRQWIEAWNLAWYPWWRRRSLIDRLRGGRSRRPGSLLRAIGALLLAVVAVPWISERAVWYVVTERQRRSPTRSTARWIARWRFGILGWADRAARVAPPADVYHGHDLAGLAAAAAARRRWGGRLVYDARDLSMDAGSAALQPAWARYPLRILERRLAGEADALVTVNRALADHLVTDVAARLVTIVGNSPPVARRQARRPGPLREALDLAGDVPLVLYHGAFAWTRGLGQLLAAQLRPELNGVVIALMGSGPLLPELERATHDPERGGSLRVLPAVPADVLIEWVADADVGASLNQPTTLNDRLSTPNKLFECLAAGVPVVSSDFPERRRVLLEDPSGPLGVLCDPADPADIASAIREILDLPRDRYMAMRQRCEHAAQERWNWEADAARLIALYGKLMTHAPSRAARSMKGAGWRSW